MSIAIYSGKLCCFCCYIWFWKIVCVAASNRACGHECCCLFMKIMLFVLLPPTGPVDMSVIHESCAVCVAASNRACGHECCCLFMKIVLFVLLPPTGPVVMSVAVYS